MCGLVSIRKATEDDASAISRVQVESWRTTYRGIVPDEYLAGLDADKRTIRWREILNSDGQNLVAEQSGDVVGFISGGPIREPLGPYDAELYAIYLLLEAQRRRIGTALLIELARLLNDEGFQSMAVWVLEANPSTRFYERSGAVLAGAKEIEIAGVRLREVAYAWPSLKSILLLQDSSAPFIGEWSLESYELRLASGAVSKPFGDHPIGRIIYTKNGQMSAQLMSPAPALFASADPEEATAAEAGRAWRDYVGYWGAFTVDPQAGVVTHHVEGGWFPNWIGQKQSRSFRFSGDQLILEADSPAWHATLTWLKLI
jgi:GNAT superfamily N-acetyltransferase